MAEFNLSQAENYGGQGGGGFFRLQNDKDVARVRILFNSPDDVKGYSVHEVDVGGKRRYVSCLKEYGDPIDVCPFCRTKTMFSQVKYFIPVYTEEIVTHVSTPEGVKEFVTPVNAQQTWERGRSFGRTLSSICSRYPDISNHTFEIERQGKAGDKKTEYMVYETGRAEPITDVTLPTIKGGIVLQKTAEEMEAYLYSGSFDSAPARRESTSNYQSNQGYQGDSSAYTRRTPAGGDTGRRAF